MSNFPAIIDLSGYTEKMRKAFLDKTFFLEKIDAKIIIDYGCADGSMIEFMYKMFPEYLYIGYDIDPDMIVLAEKKKIPNAKFFDEWNDLATYIENIDLEGRKIALICSSVVHEVYSYDHYEAEFWRRAFAFDYLVIRDMAVSDKATKMPVEISVIWDVVKYYLKNPDDSYILTDFIEKWGVIDTIDKLIHFLLKYRYKNNWKRECEENYLPLTVEKYMELAQKYGSDFECTYKNHFVLPWINTRLLADFNFQLMAEHEENTHIKLIFKRKE